MTTLRATVIMKTDISGSTVRFRALAEADLHALLLEHRAFLSRHAAAHDGRIVKPEGDGFWLVFPSVTAAALAAMAMQEDLRLAQPNAGDDRLTMRVVITLGDVLHEDGALVGDAVVLTARIEALTPPDAIYLSAAAWLAVNQAEICTAFVDTFPVKGFTEAVAVYRVEQTHRTRVLTEQYLVCTDLNGFVAFTEVAPIAVVEKVLDQLLEMVGRVCRACGGTTRFSAADAYCLTFLELRQVMAAVERLTAEWSAFAQPARLPCSLKVVVHKGVLYAFRSYLYGRDLAIAALWVPSATPRVAPGATATFVTGQVRQALAKTPWDVRLQPVDMEPTPAWLAGSEPIAVYRLL
jgi:class 3 adenylate cyclase